ncbi:MAG: URC4/urg3 family protein [Elainellaceae cyanobacterium]
MLTQLASASDAEKQAIHYLRSPQAIRDRCGQLFELACQDQLQHFRCDLDPLDRVADYVIQVTEASYPDWQVPFHSRWRHFQAGGNARLVAFNQDLEAFDPLERARIKFDLVITSVLLDAGAGADWQYQEPNTSQVFQRSEGLAVASFHLFRQGGFSSDPAALRADAQGLQQLTELKLAQGFQASDRNPLVGVAGRTQLMQRLGQVLADLPGLFGQTTPRPGYLVDYLLQQSTNNQLRAAQVFSAVLEGLSEIWAGRVTIAQVNLGDVWKHSALPDRGVGSQLVPFHKLSQWLTYSLLEPLQELGIQIMDLDELTGLPEYRNGGLCLDLGLLQAKHDQVITQAHSPDSEVIVEWRALTVILLDQIAETIRKKLGMSAFDLPLAKVLEGGTWAAGRKIAAERRAGGVPPIQITSDGTVF